MKLFAAAALAVIAILVAAAYGQNYNSPAVGNAINKVPVITNLQQMLPLTREQFIATLGSNAMWDGGGSWYRADPTNTNSADGFEIVAPANTNVGRWLRIGPLARVSVTNTVTNEVASVDIPEYYQMLTAYDEFKDYPVGAWAETNGGYGWSNSWQVTSGDAEVVTVTTTNVKFQTELRVDRRLSLNGTNSEIIRPLPLSTNWRQLLVGVRFYLPTANTNLDLVATSGRTPRMAFGLVNQTNGYNSSNHFLGLHYVGTNFISRLPPSSTFREAFPIWNQNGTNKSLYFRDALIANGTNRWESLPFDFSSGTFNYGVSGYSTSDEIAQWVLLKITRQPGDIWCISSMLKDNGEIGMMATSVEEADGEYSSVDTVHGIGAGGTTGELLDFFGMREFFSTLMGARNRSTSTEYSRYIDYDKPYKGFLYDARGNMPDEEVDGDLDALAIYWSHGDVVPMHVAEVYLREVSDYAEQAIDYDPTETVLAYRGSSSSVAVEWPIMSSMPSTNRLHRGLFLFASKDGGPYTNVWGYYTDNGSLTWNWFGGNTNFMSVSGLAAGSYDVMGRYYNSRGLGPAGYLGNIQLTSQPAAPVITSTETNDATSAVIAWMDNATNEVGYIVLRCDDRAARFFYDPFTSLSYADTDCLWYLPWDTNVWQEVGRFPTNDVPGLTWTNTGLASGSYSYMIAATNAAGDISGYLRPYYETNDVVIP